MDKLEKRMGSLESRMGSLEDMMGLFIEEVGGMVLTLRYVFCQNTTDVEDSAIKRSQIRRAMLAALGMKEN